MLAEGKAEIDKFKKTVEGGVKDAQTIYKEVKGFWGWIQKLFSPTSREEFKLAAPIASEVKPLEKKTKRKSDAELSYEEYQAREVHAICENLKAYFEAIRILKLHCQELEENSLTTEKVADSAIDRIELEWQMSQLAVQVREAMVYTPERLGLQSLYSRFLQMYEQILEEQEFARSVKAKMERDAKWQRELLRNHRIERAMSMAAVLLIILWTWGLLLSLRWLEKMPGGFLLESLF